MLPITSSKPYDANNRLAKAQSEAAQLLPVRVNLPG